MKTYYRPLESIYLEELLDGRLEQFGVREFYVPDETTEERRCLTDGREYVWVFVQQSGWSVEFKRYGLDAPGRILQAIEQAFDVIIVSEYEPQYWGFDTQEEWYASEEERLRQHREDHYLMLVKFVHGEPNDIRPGTVDEIEGKLAKQLVIDRPELLLPEMKDEFFRAIEDACRREVSVTVTEQGWVFTKKIATHEDDLPSA